jgi:hypothetical protein
MDGDEVENWYRRKVGRTIELGANKLLGWMLLVIALFALWVTLTSETFAPSTHWPAFPIAAMLLLLSRLCFRTKTGIIQGVGEEPDGTLDRRKPRD